LPEGHNLQYNYQSPYINNTVGNDVVTITYGDAKWEYDFENNTVTVRLARDPCNRPTSQ